MGCHVCGLEETARTGGFSVCEYPLDGDPSCERRLCRDHARFFGPAYFCACPEHAAAIQDHVLTSAIEAMK